MRPDRFPPSFRIAGSLAAAVLPLALATSCSRESHKLNPGSAKAASFDSSVANQWMQLLYDIVKDTPLAPPAASRAYAYAGVTLYESVVPGMPRYQSLAGQLNDFAGVPHANGIVDYRIVANRALAQVIRNGIVPGIKVGDVTACDNLESSLESTLQAGVSAAVDSRSVTLGDDIATAILAWAATDGYSDFHNCTYTPPVGPGLWVSTTTPASNPTEPCWGLLRPFALIPASECAPGPHPTWDETPSSAFWDEANEVYTTTGDVGTALSPEQKEIAFFWSDGGGATGTPPGHWVSITAQILEADGLSLEVAAEAYAKVGIAVADAFISCWQAKYQYNLERPITYIQRVIDAAWHPLLTTPNFPEYTSGHSVQSGAAARVLTDVFGAHAFSDDTHNLHNNSSVLTNAPNPRSFADFDTAAAEAAISRLYGGIHYRSAIDNGVLEGTCVGDTILQRIAFLR